jgi:RNA polymerase sigma-70 factor (ECF subfamily)
VSHSGASNRKSLPAELDARYRVPLVNYFQRRLGCRTDAEDLTQEVFLRLANWAEAEGAEIADGLIFTIAANLLRDRARRARTRSSSRHVELGADDGLEGETALVDSLEPERILISREALAQVLSALDMVGSRTRDVFLLYRFEGKKQREIAELFGISVSAVEKHIVKALKQVAAALVVHDAD